MTTTTPHRDSHGRFEADHHLRNTVIGATVAVAGAAAGIAAAFRFGLIDRLRAQPEGHGAEDLLIDTELGPNHRAPVAFRPDMDAPMTPAEREALRPPQGQPTLTSPAGTGFAAGGDR